MVDFYRPSKKNKAPAFIDAQCHALDLHGRGVAKAAGKVWFVPGLMPGEQAKLKTQTSKDKTGSATVVKLTAISPLRQKPDCKVQQACGGCPLQHLPLDMALKAKVDNLSALISKTLDLPSISPAFIESGSGTGYRRACRLAVRKDHGRVRLGFRAAFSHDLVPIDSCLVLTLRINQLIKPLTAVLNQLSIKEKLGHVEFIDSDNKVGILLRVLAEPNTEDQQLLRNFGAEYACVISVGISRKHYIDDSDIVEEVCLTDNLKDLELISGGCTIRCLPSSFVQINKNLNQRLIERVLAAVNLQSGMKVLDLFCGLGNFSLPLAKSGAQVVGIDIVGSMIKTANENAKLNDLNQLSFAAADLEAPFESQLWAKQSYNAAVLDPGRSGAKRATAFVAKLKIPKIVMVSCNPLAALRDCRELIRQGYTLEQWGVCDMFPRTAHAEMLLSFVLKQ